MISNKYTREVNQCCEENGSWGKRTEISEAVVGEASQGR